MISLLILEEQLCYNENEMKRKLVIGEEGRKKFTYNMSNSTYGEYVPVTEQCVPPQGFYLGPSTRIDFRHEEVVERLHRTYVRKEKKMRCKLCRMRLRLR